MPHARCKPTTSSSVCRMPGPKKKGGWGGGGDDHDNLTDKICKSITFIASLNSEEIFLLIVFQLQAMFVRRILL